MAKITRYGGDLKAFASEQDTNERTVFGGETIDDTLDANINADFLRGWGIVPPSGEPTLEDFNAAFYTLGQLLAYLHQAGVAEWHTDQEYFQGSVAINSGSFWQSTVATPTEEPGTGSEWRKLLDGTDIGLTDDLLATNAQRLRQADVTMGATDVTLTESDATADLINLTGTLTADVALIVPDTARKYTIVNSTSGSFTVTVKTSAGDGIVVPQGQARVLRSDGTDVVDGIQVAAGQVLYDNTDSGLDATTSQAAIDESFDKQIGWNQTWQNVFSERSAGVTYTNTTGRPIFVSIAQGESGSGAEGSLVVDGVTVAYIEIPQVSAWGETATLTAIVPDGSTYQHNDIQGVIKSWAELR